MNRISIGGGFVLSALLLALPVRAWVYPEHRAITGTAVESLDPARRRALERLWEEARKGHEERLCATPWAGDQGRKPPCMGRDNGQPEENDTPEDPTRLLHVQPPTDRKPRKKARLRGPKTRLF